MINRPAVDQEPVGLGVVGGGVVGGAVVCVGGGVVGFFVGELEVCGAEALVDVAVVADVVVVIAPPPPCWLFAEVVLADAVADLLGEALALAEAVNSPKLDVSATVDGLPLTTDVVDVAAVFGEG
jgi:hypothetical protein